MQFYGALFALKRGHKVKRACWSGYWKLSEDGKNIDMHCRDGSVIKFTDTDDLFYTLENVSCDDWEIVNEYI
jgi:hypothetical protein